jgi:hypothetical protein
MIQRKGDDTWNSISFEAHNGGVNSISWGPATDPSMLSQQHPSSQLDQQQFALPPKRFVSAGNDKLVKYWTFKDGKFIEQQ